MLTDITHEIEFKTARSGGKGGQNVNKVETMVEGRWKVEESALVSKEQQQKILQKLGNKITADGYLLVKSQVERTQLGNKALVIKKMNELISKALIRKKMRVPTKPSAASKEKRIESKKKKSDLKETRRKIFSIVFISLFALSCSSSKPAAKPMATATNANTGAKLVAANIAPAIEEQILTLINKHRKSKGLEPLQNNYVIASLARQHTMNMATRRVAFGHAGFSTRSKVIVSKVPGVKMVAENVAYGTMTAAEVVEGWLNSPTHKKNIEGNYRLTGIGVARDVKSKLYFTQLFAN